MKLNNQLIEQIKQGKAVIQMPPNPSEDNVKLLNSIYESYIGYNPLFFGTRKYYNHYCGSDYNDDGLLPIPLSSFLTKDKQMISVEEVLEWIEQNKQEVEGSESGERSLDGFDYIDYHELKQFLTDKNK